MIESTSLSHTFFMESAFVAVSAVIIFLLLRNSPEDKCLLPLFTGKVEKHAEQAAKFHGTDRKSFIIMLISIFIIGAISNPGFSHLSVLYESEGYDSMKVAAIISFAGMALTAGKCIYGQITDRFGAYKSGFVFFGALVAGEILCCFAGNSSLTVAMAAMFCLGLVFRYLRLAYRCSRRTARRLQSTL
jgi:predicted MFS family arabinose efflux permease